MEATTTNNAPKEREKTTITTSEICILHCSIELARVSAFLEYVAYKNSIEYAADDAFTIHYFMRNERDKNRYLMQTLCVLPCVC